MGELYDRLLDMNNLHDAFVKCRSGVDWKESVQKYALYELPNLCALRDSLKDHTYRQKPFFEFDINERGKVRHIRSLHISDRVLQRALCDQVLIPELSKYLIYDNGASIKGKGVDFARRRLKAHLSRYYREYGRDGYVLLIDFSKYFDSIRHDRLLEMFEERIKDDEVMWLLRHLIETFDTPENKGRSVGIGSQVSQISGVLYRTNMDNYCKIVRGVRYYGGYMDDTYVIHHDKRFLRGLLDGIREVCAGLGIVINEKKTQIIKLLQGFTFLKMRYIITETGKIVVIPCRKSIIRERRKLKKLKSIFDDRKLSNNDIKLQYKSWRGNVIKYNSRKSIQNMDYFYKSLYGGVYETGK